MSMEASQTMAAWAADGQAPFPGPAVNSAFASAAQTCGDRSQVERFEVEAMPHLNDLFRTALRMTGKRGQAEDVVQEVYLQAWRSFERFEAGTNCRAWLYKILFHCASHQRRKWFRLPLLKENEEYLEANIRAKEPTPDRLTDGEILAALDRISADYRSVVLLVDV